MFWACHLSTEGSQKRRRFWPHFLGKTSFRPERFPLGSYLNQNGRLSPFLAQAVRHFQLGGYLSYLYYSNLNFQFFNIAMCSTRFSKAFALWKKLSCSLESSDCFMDTKVLWFIILVCSKQLLTFESEVCLRTIFHFQKKPVTPFCIVLCIASNPLGFASWPFSRVTVFPPLNLLNLSCL